MTHGMSAPLGRTIGPQGSSTTGTVTVSVTPNTATWTLYGPTNTTGTGDSTMTGKDTGAYYVVWDAVSGYVTPNNSYGVLEEDETLQLTGVYMAVGSGYSGGIGSLLYDELNYFAPVRTNNGAGEWDVTYPSSVTIYGRYQSNSSNEGDQGEKFVGKITPVVYLDPTADVDLNGKIVRVSDSRAMRITRIESPSVNIYQKIIGEETQVEGA